MRWMLLAAMLVTMLRASRASAYDPDAYLRQQAAIADERVAIENRAKEMARPAREIGVSSLLGDAFPWLALGGLLTCLLMLRQQGRSLNAALDKLTDIERRVGPGDDDEDSIEARRARQPMQTVGR